jgi:hypothetical protein
MRVRPIPIAVLFLQQGHGLGPIGGANDAIEPVDASVSSNEKSVYVDGQMSVMSAGMEGT